MMEEASDDFEYRIENVVATANFDISTNKLDLMHIARSDPEVEFNPERFPGLIMRLEKPKATYLIFSTGKMVITGLRSSELVDEAVENAMKRIRKTRIKVSNPRAEVRNVVASGNLHTHIDLNMAALLLEYSMYEPEVFPGLIYRLQEPKCCFLIFSTGSCVCTGAKCASDVKEAYIKLRKEIKEHGLEASVKEESDFEDITFI